MRLVSADSPRCEMISPLRSGNYNFLLIISTTCDVADVLDGLDCNTDALIVAFSLLMPSLWIVVDLNWPPIGYLSWCFETRLKTISIKSRSLLFAYLPTVLSSDLYRRRSYVCYVGRAMIAIVFLHTQCQMHCTRCVFRYNSCGDQNPNSFKIEIEKWLNASSKDRPKKI